MLSEFDYTALLPFKDGMPRSIDSGSSIEYERITGFVERKLLRCKRVNTRPSGNGENLIFAPYNVYVITVAGFDALAEFEHGTEQKAKDEKQRRFQNKVSIASILVPLITFIIGLVVEHYAGIITFIAELFRNRVK